jgi:hypothetical protein
MCGRFTEELVPAELGQRFQLKLLGEKWFPSDWTTYNAAPS